MEFRSKLVGLIGALIASCLPAFAQSTPTARYNTVADMLAVPVGPNPGQRLTANVTGRVTANDGGGGVFFYDPTSAISTNLGTVFKPDASGGRWLRQIEGELNALWFGAVPGDGNNDQAALQNAADIAALNVPARLRIPKGDYDLDSALVLSGDIEIHGDGVENTRLLPSGDFIAIQGRASTNAIASSSLSTLLQANKGSLDVVSAAGIPAGSIINLQSDVLWYYDNRGTLFKGETHRVQRISGTTLFLNEQSNDSYNVPTETVTVTAWAPLTLKLSGFTLEYPANTSTTGILIEHNYKSLISSVQVLNCTESGLQIYQSVGVTVEDSFFQAINDSGTGYGIFDSASTGTTINNCRFLNCRRGVDFSGTTPSRWGIVSDCYVNGQGLDSTGADLYPNSSGYGTHGTAEHISFIDNRVDYVTVGFVLRGGDITVKDNHLFGRIPTGVTITHGTSHTIQGNTYDYGLESRVLIGSPNNLNFVMDYFVECTTTNNAGFLAIKDNTVNNLRVTFLRIGNALLPEFDRLYVSGNVINFRPISGDVTFIEGAAAIELQNSRIFPAEMETVSGAIDYFGGSSVTMDTESCDFSNFPITDSTALEVYGPTGQVTNITVNVSVNKSDGIVTAAGFLRFDIVNGSAPIRLVGMPRSQGYSFKNFVDSDGVTRIMRTTESGEFLYFGRYPMDYASPFFVRTNYLLPFSLSYKAVGVSDEGVGTGDGSLFPYALGAGLTNDATSLRTSLVASTNITILSTNNTLYISSSATSTNGGTVGNFSAQDWPPFFTTTVANPTTSPDLSFDDTDPGHDSIMMWDDTQNAYVQANIGSNLSYDSGTETLSATGGGGSGSVTNISVGNLSPFWSANVADPTTDPDVTFTNTDPGFDSVHGWDDTEGAAKQLALPASVVLNAATDALELDGDDASPADGTFYGKLAGNKGWFDLTNALSGVCTHTTNITANATNNIFSFVLPTGGTYGFTIEWFAENTDGTEGVAVGKTAFTVEHGADPAVKSQVNSYVDSVGDISGGVGAGIFLSLVQIADTGNNFVVWVQADSSTATAQSFRYVVQSFDLSVTGSPTPCLPGLSGSGGSGGGGVAGSIINSGGPEASIAGALFYADGTSGTNALPSNITITSKTNLLAATLTATNWVRFPFTTLTYTGGTNVLVDLSAGSVFGLTLTNTAFIIPTNVPSLSQTLYIHLLQDGVGGRTVTWEANTKWPSGAAPVISAAANAYDLVTLTRSFKTSTNLAATIAQDFQ